MILIPIRNENIRKRRPKSRRSIKVKVEGSYRAVAERIRLRNKRKGTLYEKSP